MRIAARTFLAMMGRAARPARGRRRAPGGAGAILISVLLASSCAAPGERAGSEGGGPNRDAARADGSAAAASAASVLGTGESGLRIRQWRADDETTSIARALMRHADPDWPPEETRRRLRRNGFRMVRVPVDAVETLPEELGGTTLDLDGWHGQMLEWRELAGRDIEPEGRAVAMAGRVRRFGGGRMRLMMRGWTMQMEQGPRLYVELLPEHDQSRPTRLDQMLGRRPFTGERFLDLAMDMLLETGSAYVLTCEAPGVEWIAGQQAAAAPRPAAGPGPDGPGGVGPDVAVPPAIGELLMRRSFTPPQRDLAVFIPMIPPELFPPGTAVATSKRREDAERTGP